MYSRRLAFVILWLLSMTISVPSHAGIYEYTFLANSDADQSITPDHNLDLNYTIRFDSDKFPAFDLRSLNESRHWIDREITLRMAFESSSVFLNDALDPTAPFLAIKQDLSGSDAYAGGFVEIYGTMSEFLDIDFHPWSSFVLDNHLPFTPFVYGQLDVYDDQASFRDFYDLWVFGNASNLELYAVSTVPEQSTSVLVLIGGCLIWFATRIPRRLRPMAIT